MLRQALRRIPPAPILNLLPRPIVMSLPIHTSTELQQQIHGDLRIQHPEWVKPNGESPMCDSYEMCLTKMLDTLTRRRSSESIVPPDGRIGIGVRLKSQRTTHAITKPTRPITNMIMPNCGKTPGTQRAIPIARKKNAHRWMFLILPGLS